MTFSTTTLKVRPDATCLVEELGSAWPEFLHHGEILNWQAIYERFPGYQILLHDESGTLLGVGHCAPIRWDGSPEDLPENIHTIIARACDLQEIGDPPNTVSALAIIVKPEFQRQGHSARILTAMRELAATMGGHSVIAPVRPILKSRYPLVDFARYLQWTQPDGSPFDPWIRLHWRMGARQVHIAPTGIRVEGTVSEWENWTNLRFPDSGDYTVDGALQPVHIDVQQDLGRYDDPNIWMQHDLTAENQTN